MNQIQPENDVRQHEVFDHAEFLNRVMNKVDLANRLLDLFMARSDAVLANLQQSVNQQDLSEVAIQAHSLKGAAASISANDLAANARQLEFAAKQGDLEDIQKQAEMLEAKYFDLREHLDNWKERVRGASQDHPSA